MQALIDQLTVWLTVPLPRYWLVGCSFILILTLVINGIRARKKLRDLNEEREQLAIARASNEQRITQLERDYSSSEEQVKGNSIQIQQLIAQTAELKASRDEKLSQVQSLENERAGLREIQENYQRKTSRLESDIREQAAHLTAERDKLIELKSEFDRQKTELKTEFKSVSEEIMKERQKILADQNKEGVSALLKPLQDQIQGFQKRVNEVHSENIKDNSTLKSEIENVRRMGLQMQEEASNLTTALKGDSQQRGAWGEAQLERTLELSGLIPNDHYVKQSAFIDDEGKRKQTDYLVKLPGEKCIIIDSKVSLNAYEKASSGEVEQQHAAMRLHVAAVRKHIDDLASKDYVNLSAIHSPDFVLMFMPIEPAYIEAMKHDTQLFAYGYQRNVILVSHTTLIPILRTVANLWMLDRSNKEARLLGDSANDIFNSVATVSERLESLGRALGTVSNHYNKTVTAISGKQGLQGKIKRFADLSSKASKDMPELEHKHHEFETNRLEVELLPESNTEQDDKNRGID